MSENPQILTNYFKQEKIVLWQIPPQLTNPQIDNWLDSHYVAFSTQIPHRQELLLFLGGSFGKPGQQKLFLKEAVNLGYIVINLNYPNTWTVANLCQSSLDLDCHYKIRKGIIYGQKKKKNKVVNKANSLEDRLVKLLLFLSKNIPEIPWLNYLNEKNTPLWNSFVIAGHSQGGGHAAIIAKENLVSRVIMFASPADYHRQTQQPAPWLSFPSVTPSDRYFGFIHYQDQGYREVIKAWQKLGLNDHGTLVNIDSVDISSLKSHQLVTNQIPKNENKFHGSVITDFHTPRNTQGQPIYQKIWGYLCS